MRSEKLYQIFVTCSGKKKATKWKLCDSARKAHEQLTLSDTRNTKKENESCQKSESFHTIHVCVPHFVATIEGRENPQKALHVCCAAICILYSIILRRCWRFDTLKLSSACAYFVPTWKRIFLLKRERKRDAVYIVVFDVSVRAWRRGREVFMSLMNNNSLTIQRIMMWLIARDIFGCCEGCFRAPGKLWLLLININE